MVTMLFASGWWGWMTRTLFDSMAVCFDCMPSTSDKRRTVRCCGAEREVPPVKPDQGVLARRNRRQVFAVGQLYQCQGAIECKAVRRFTVCEVWPNCHAILSAERRQRIGRNSEWMCDGVAGAGRTYPEDVSSASVFGPADVAPSRAPQRRGERPFRGSNRAHGKRSYVSVFAFETSAFAGACS